MSGPLLSAPSANFIGRMAERSLEPGTVPASAAPQPGEEERQRPAADGRGRAAPGDAEVGGGVGGGGGAAAGGGGGGGGGGGKKRHRRRPSKKKRRWKPYFKLSWEEKKKLDERESVRAAKTRAEMFAKGFTVAPYNTTQFLMEEHNQEEPDLNTGGGPGGGAGGGPGVCPRRAAKADETSEEEEEADEEEQQDSGSDGMGGDGGGEFLRRDFSETYERFHAESLQNMTKQELIREYLELEKCLSRLEDENNRLRGRPDGVRAARGADPAASESRLGELEREMERLRAQNLQLLQENELYKPGQRLSESAD